MLHGKKLLIGVCGSIAAYKVANLVRLFVKAGSDVKVIMTQAATEFITPLTLATLSKNPVLSEFSKGSTGEWNNHVDLGLWADLYLIAPASANTIGKMANGLCDNLLLATYLSSRCPVYFAPAMDLDMYQHPSVKENINKLLSFGNQLIDVESGELASGLSGQGRMAEPENIFQKIQDHFTSNSTLKGKRVLITSGPTYEPIDPVRFIGNHSSGKMGRALAEEMASQGCEVTLISGPTSNGIVSPNYKVEKVISANEMYEKALSLHKNVDIAIFAAAVADYRPAHIADQKIKKSNESMSIELVKNKDIARELGKLKKNQFHVGFALETENEDINALEKLNKKNFDLIVLNSLNHQGAGFAHDTNQVTIFSKDNNPIKFGLKSKTEVAKDIVNEIKKAL